MLYDFQNKKKIEITYLWNTLLLLSKLTKNKIKFTKNIYYEVIKKVKLNSMK